ncbi:MAG: hypothetical protein JOZ32_01675 [Bryobacterales bacterium]|nr:hypothetical protein [Bryobacterales bacterium]
MESIIRIWRFKDAPQHLQALHPGGTESTWVMEAPAGMSGEAESMIEERSHLHADISRYPLADGTVVFFGQSLAAGRATGSIH